MPIAFGIALMIGASLALFGAGGSIVTVPVLVYVLGLDAHRAAATSLVVVGTVAMAGALAQRRDGNLRLGLLFGAAGAVGAVPGAWINHRVPATVVLLGCALIMLAAAARMGTGTMGRMGRHEPARHVAPVSAAAVGIGIGVATGLFGVGGGFLIVPALTLLLGTTMQCAVATSLIVVALNSAAALAAHVVHGAVEWRLGATLTVPALAGAALTLPLARRLRGATVQRGFAGMLAVLGFTMLVAAFREILA
jgi:uncharacterized membrane protein YfcA